MTISERFAQWWRQLWCDHIYRVIYKGTGDILCLRCSICGYETHGSSRDK